MATPRTTSSLTFGTWTTVQMWLTGGNQLSDTAPLDDLGGPGPYLVLERGVWKYPQQAAGGRIAIPSNQGRPVRLNSIMADFGDVAATWTLHVAGIDNTADRPDNVSGEPYAAADAPLYREGDLVVANGTGRYLATNFDPVDSGTAVLLHPGQHVYIVTTLAVAPLIRMTFNLAVENVG